MELNPKLPLLLIDDDREYLNSFELTLLSYGVTNIIKCYEGRKAIEILRQQQIGLVVSDLSMPEVSGLALLDFIKKCCPEIPVIIVTANIESQCKNMCLERGAFAFHNKPCPGDTIYDFIVRALA